MLTLIPISNFPEGFGNKRIMSNSVHFTKDSINILICADQSIEDLSVFNRGHHVRVHTDIDLICKCQDKFTQSNIIAVTEPENPDSYSTGDILLNNQSSPLMNGMSTMKDIKGGSLQISVGFPMVVCKNQYIDRRNYGGKDELGKKVVRCHYVVDRTGHSSDCGCNYRYLLREYPIGIEGGCHCEELAPIDPGKESCVVM